MIRPKQQLIFYYVIKREFIFTPCLMKQTSSSRFHYLQRSFNWWVDQRLLMVTIIRKNNLKNVLFNFNLSILLISTCPQNSIEWLVGDFPTSPIFATLTINFILIVSLATLLPEATAVTVNIVWYLVCSKHDQNMEHWERKNMIYVYIFTLQINYWLPLWILKKRFLDIDDVLNRPRNLNL